jgi:hypothetical protein
MANNPHLVALARHLLAAPNANQRAPAVPAYQMPFAGLHNEPYGALPPYQPPGTDAAAAIASARPIVPPAPPPMTPPAIAPGDQTVPPTPLDPNVMPSTSSIDNKIAQNGPSTPGFWDRINKALAAQQVPDGYRGAMGEMIKNG